MDIMGRQLAYSLAFNPDGTLLAVATESFSNSGKTGVVELWGVASSRLLFSLPAYAGGNLEDLAFSPDGSTLAILASAHGGEAV
jgi:WD40 repeat protein